MMQRIEVNGPVSEAEVWLAEELLQIRFKCQPNLELSRWLGFCRQWFLTHFQLKDVVPGAASLTLIGIAPAQVEALIESLQHMPEVSSAVHKIHEIEVGYHPNWMDTTTVCQKTGLSFEQLFSLHSNSDYYLAFIGFLPGFLYLGGGHPLLDLPRLDTPRSRIPKGSVGIASGYTGIYPESSPGGWHIIGHTSQQIFTTENCTQDLWLPGDRIRLLPFILENAEI